MLAHLAPRLIVMKSYGFLWRSLIGLAIAGFSGVARGQYIVQTVAGPGMALTTADGMSNNGWIDGTFTPTGSSVGHIGIYNYITGAFQDLGPYVAGYTQMNVGPVNNSGQVLAETNDGTTQHYAYLYSPGSAPVPLGALPGATGSTTVYAINDSGVIVGQSYVGNSTQQGFVYRNGVMTALAAPASSCEWINDAGTICGFSSAQSGAYCGTIWSPSGEPQLFPAVSGYFAGINDFNTAVGVSSTGQGGSVEPVMASGTTVTVLPDLPQGIQNGFESAWAFSIDDNNHVVGFCQLPDATDTLVAILWDQAKAYNLNNFAALPNGDTLSGATQISPTGVILAGGTIDNYAYSYVLTPPITISATTSPAGAATLRGAGGYLPGHKVNFGAAPKAGYSFVNWTNDGIVVSSNPTWSTTAGASQSYTANFTATSLTFSSPSVTGGTDVTATLDLGHAVSADQSFNLTSTTAVTTLPSGPVTVPAGSSSVSFDIGTTGVLKNTIAHITATGPSKVVGSFAIAPPQLASIFIANPTGIGGAFSPVVTLTLTGPAPAGAYVKFPCSNGALYGAYPTSTGFPFPAGQTTASFTLTTKAVKQTVEATFNINGLVQATNQGPITINP